MGSKGAIGAEGAEDDEGAEGAEGFVGAEEEEGFEGAENPATAISTVKIQCFVQITTILQKENNYCNHLCH